MKRLITILMLSSLALAADYNHKGSIVANPKQAVGTTGGTVTVSGYVAGEHYVVNCNSTGCSEDAGLELVIKTDDGRYLHIQPVPNAKGGNPLHTLEDEWYPYNSKHEAQCTNGVTTGCPTFTYYEKPLKGFVKGTNQLCTAGDNGQDACYVEGHPPSSDFETEVR